MILARGSGLGELGEDWAGRLGGEGVGGRAGECSWEQWRCALGGEKGMERIKNEEIIGIYVIVNCYEAYSEQGLQAEREKVTKYTSDR